MIKLMSWVTAFACTSGAAWAQDADSLYRAGTDSAMHYLAEHGGALRLTLLLQECNLDALAGEAGAGLPNSVQWFMSGDEARNISPDLVSAAAQVARGYLLGFEVGVRTEFQRQSDEIKQYTCNLAAEAAGR